MNHVLYELPLLTSQQCEVIAWTHTAFHLFRIFKKSSELTLRGYTSFSMECFLERIYLTL